MAMLRTYTETYDMNTEEGCPTLLGIHTPIGSTMYRFLAPAFRMYKKYKYLGCDVTIVNAARLPVDPEQLGRIEGTNYVSPKDTLNPIMFKGCHGESLGAVLDSMYDGLLYSHIGSSLDREKFKAALEAFYYTALGDDSWRKSGIQKTLHLKNLHPLVYSLSTQHQILPTNNLDSEKYRVNVPQSAGSSPSGTGNTSGSENGQFGGPSYPTGWGVPGIAPSVIYRANGDADTPQYLSGMSSMFTSKMHRLGWLDTLQFIGHNVPNSNAGDTTVSDIALLPKCLMGLLMLPPSYLCRQYLRVIIRHKIKFAGYRTITSGGALDGYNPESDTYGYNDWITGNVSDGGSKQIEDYDREELEGDEEDE